jgi:glutaredoxin
LRATAVARKVVVFSKRGCHLCEAVEAELRSMAIIEASLTMVDIDEDPKLHDMYWLRVPVVRVDGKDVFEAKLMDLKGEWKKRLAHLLGWRATS